MNSRNNIQRTQQWQLAERQRYLTELEALGDKLRADAERLGKEIEEGGGVAAASPGRQADPHFIRPLVERREKLLRSISEVDAQIVEAREALAVAQQEAKLVEGALMQRGLKFEDRLTRRARRSQ